MSTAHEIEDAIRALSATEREKLIKSLPALLPELDGDLTWNQIIGGAQPRPAFIAFLDQTGADFKKNPAAFPEITDSEFDSRS